MAKRQNFVVGSTNAVTEQLTPTELNHGFDQYEILTADELDGVFNAVSDYSNDSSNEIANAIQSITGTEPTGATETELADALQQMRDEITTSSLRFRGYVSTTEPSSSSYALNTGNLWINSATMPTSFPVAASDIKEWDGSAWVNYGASYTPANFECWRNINDTNGYYWFGGTWTVMSTDMSTTYFTLNAGGKWEIKTDVNLPGSPTTTTASASDNSTKIATTQWVNTVGNNVMHLSGNETAGGDKTFTGLIAITQRAEPRLDMASTEIDITQNGWHAGTSRPAFVRDKNGNECAGIWNHVESGGDIYTDLYAISRRTGTQVISRLRAGIDSAGNPYAYCSPSDRLHSILTTEGLSKSREGFFKLGNGMIIQWGRVDAISAGSYTTVNLPTAFWDADYSVVVSSATGSVAGAAGMLSAYDKTTTTFKVDNSNVNYTDPVQWIAIGW